MTSITAIGTTARLKLIIEGNSSRLYVWSYTIEIDNQSDSDLLLVGRRWWIDEGKGAKLVPSEGYAPSIGGDHPLVPAGEKHSYEAGVTTKAKRPVAMRGEFSAFQVSKGAIELPVREFTFEVSNLEVPTVSAAGKLTGADAAKLNDYIKEYEALAAKPNGKAFFQVDEIGLSGKGAILLDAFLLASEYATPAKVREFDFSPILPERYKVNDAIRHCDDHYFLPRKTYESNTSLYFSFVISYRMPLMPQRVPSKGAALKVEITKLVADYGFRDVIIEVAGHAPTGENAAKQDNPARPASSKDAVDRLLDESGVSSISRDVTRLEVLATLLRNTSPKWRERNVHGGELASLTAPNYLRRVLPQLVLPDGTVYMDLVKIVDRDLALALDQYILGRTRRGITDPGDGKGLKLVTKHPLPNTRLSSPEP